MEHRCGCRFAFLCKLYLLHSWLFIIKPADPFMLQPKGNIHPQIFTIAQKETLLWERSFSVLFFFSLQQLASGASAALHQMWPLESFLALWLIIKFSWDHTAEHVQRCGQALMERRRRNERQEMNPQLCQTSINKPNRPLNSELMSDDYHSMSLISMLPEKKSHITSQRAFFHCQSKIKMQSP